MERAFQEADWVKEAKFGKQIQMHGFVEPLGALASFSASGKRRIAPE